MVTHLRGSIHPFGTMILMNWRGRCDVIRAEAECERREKPEIFQRAEERIFRQTGKG